MIRRSLASLAIAVGGLASPVGAEPIVLVHGAFQTAAAWSEVETRLEAMGHDVVRVDLPGWNAEGEAAQAVTLDAYVTAVSDAVAGLDAQVVLVGHSFGGMAISAVAERMPDAVKRLVYVAAYLPADGESMEALSGTDTDNAFREGSFVLGPDHSYAEIRMEDRAAIFIGDGTPAQQAAVMGAMVREPLGPIGTPVALTDAFDGVPKTYLRTTLDGAVSAPLQSRMLERAGVTDVTDIASGHSPQVTQLEALVAALDTAARAP